MSNIRALDGTESDYPVQHLGGIHSGCALSGVGWLILKVVTVYRHRHIEHTSILVVGLLTNLAVVITALAAMPWVRNTHHKYVDRTDNIHTSRLLTLTYSVFERHHRFVGWTALFLTCKANFEPLFPTLNVFCRGVYHHG